jgi:Membrane carboxypeptidase (penicillin-binding protein)
MQTDQQTGETPRPEDSALVGPERPDALVAAPAHRLPAKLPIHSQAALAQRLNDIAPPPEPGLSYPMAHNPQHPRGWHRRRHMKRQRLRAAMRSLYVTERTGTRTLLPLAFIYMLILMVIVVVSVSVIGFINATHEKYGNASTTLEDILPRDNLKIYDARGNIIYQMADQGFQTSLPLSKVSPHLVHAEIAIEDQNFYKNAGYDITGIVRAAVSNMTEGHVVSGGSTITQQIIKNAIVGNQTTALRKLQEIILAPEVTRHYTKEQILAMYLNTTYYGEQAYGAEAAAFIYYGLKDTPTQTAAQQLDLAQAAMLAGIPSSPVARDPFLHPHAAHVRVTEVLQQMYVQHYITASERDDAMRETLQPSFLRPGVINNRLAPHYASYTLRELSNDMSVKISDLSRSGLKVQTALDLDLQNKVLLDAQKHIAEMSRAHNMSNAAVVVIDNHTGNIRTIVGNINPDNPIYGDFDVATQGYRQPGSSFKPYIYATAFDMGISPGAMVLDGPLAVSMCCGLPAYVPRNYDLRYHGAVTYRYALQNSFNIPAVKLLMRVGVDHALQVAQDMGLTTYTGIPNYTMVLGSLGVRLLDNTAAYSTFANGGIRIPPHAIVDVIDHNGKVILRPATTGKRVLSQAAAFMITNVLSDNQSRIFEFGRCSSLLLYPNTENQCYAGNTGPIRPSAAKTGTSNDFRDNWTMGYTTDFTVGVWAGNNDNTPMVNVTGVDGAGPIWHDTMLMVGQGHPIRDFAGPPASVVRKTVTYGRLRTTDWYLRQP